MICGLTKHPYLHISVGVSYNLSPQGQRSRMKKRAEKYKVYINSKEWKEKAAQAKAAAGGRCQLCNRSKNLVVHHRQYPRQLGDEPLSYLTVLCKDCHNLFHKYRTIASPSPTPAKDEVRAERRRLRMAARHGSTQARIKLKEMREQAVFVRKCGPVKKYSPEEIAAYAKEHNYPTPTKAYQQPEAPQSSNSTSTSHSGGS